ncbi:MAG: histidinol-phosphatase HisJ family protein [Planctomycetota bacterium]|nr:histidinol-phosphatase HisJ family protein [Planctomycetota bacterium]
MLTDSHQHSNLSVDGKSGPAEMFSRAVAEGLGAVCLTEHVDFDPGNPHFGYYDHAAVQKSLDSARPAFKGRLEIRTGVELDLQPEYLDAAREFLRGKRLDLALGSFHFVNQEFVGTAAYFRTFAPRNKDADPGRLPYSGNYREVVEGIDPALVEEGIRVYFNRLADIARTAEFDVLAHFDLIKWQGAATWADDRLARCAEAANGILKLLVSRGKGLEVNTKGLRLTCNETFPSLALLRAYRQAGGEIVTVGSDAHRAEETGSGIATAYGLLREAGFKFVSFFRERRPHMIPL